MQINKKYKKRERKRKNKGKNKKLGLKKRNKVEENSPSTFTRVNLTDRHNVSRRPIQSTSVDRGSRRRTKMTHSKDELTL